MSVIGVGLTAAERQNVRISGDRVELRNPNAIDTKSASPAYQGLHTAVTDPNRTLNYVAVNPGETVVTPLGQTISHDDLLEWGGVTVHGEGANAGIKDIVVPVGGADPVERQGGGLVAFPEDVIFAHEAYGHGLGNDDVSTIGIENAYRASRNPALPARSGADHHSSVDIVSPSRSYITRLQLFAAHNSPEKVWGGQARVSSCFWGIADALCGHRLSASAEARVCGQDSL